MRSPEIEKLIGSDGVASSTLRPRICVWYRTACATFCFLMSAFTLLAAARAQDPEPPPEGFAMEDERPLPGDWAVALLDRISNSSSPEAKDDLFRAVMAAGPAVIPMLEPGLQDDRTAEFAAQALAFIGGEKALKLLWGLTTDRRDLNLRRFYYGALGEFGAPEAAETLLDVIRRADDEPDRTVTETAIVALTVRSDPKLLPPLREAEKNIEDIVIKLDLENAIEVIERRAKYLAAGQKEPGGSVDYAIRTYFAPALDLGPESADPGTPTPKRVPARGSAAKPPARPAPPPIKVQVQNITLSPGQTRALARVVFEDPSASATYDIVLQKQYGNWMVASVWTGIQTEKSLPEPGPSKAKPAN